MTKINPLLKPKKVSVSKLKKKADLLFSNFIRKRDKGKCFTCGCVKEWKHQQCGHYVSRSCLPLRYDERNCHCQCVGCNIFKKGNMDVYALKLMKKYGEDILYDLDEIKKESIKNPGKYGSEFYQRIIDIYGQ
jgi:hypothetical protein